MAVINPYLLLLGLVDVDRSQAVHSCCFTTKHAFTFDDLLALISDAIAVDGQLAYANSANHVLLLDPYHRPLDYRDHRFISRELCLIQCLRCGGLLA